MSTVETTEKKGLNRGQWFVLIAAFLGWMFDGVEIGLLPLVSKPALQDLLGMTNETDISKWMSRIIAAFLIGAAIGGVSLGWLGDKIGRVRGMVICMLTYSLFTGACYWATAPWQIGLCVFIAALGMGGEWSLAVALVMECWPERHRSKLAGIIGAACNVGFLFIALVAMQWQVTIHAWRWMMLVGASPAVLALLIIFFVPESERWKAAAKKGGRSPLLEIFAPGIRSKTFLAMIVAGIPLLGTWAAVSAYIPGWVDDMAQTQAAKGKLSEEEKQKLESLKTRVERKTFLKESLSDEDRNAVIHESARAKASVQFVMAIGAIIACIVASELGRKLGRRPVYCMLCLLSFITCSYLFWFLKVYDAWFMFVAFIVGGVTAAFYGWLPLYLPELFPTRIRATGQGLTFNFGRILAATGTLCLGQFIAFFDNDYGKAMGTVALVYLVGMIIIWFGPETKGKPLPE